MSDRVQRPEWERLHPRSWAAEAPGEWQRIDDLVSRPTDETGGGDSFAHPGMGGALTPTAVQAVWGRITGAYAAEGSGLPLYTFELIVHDGNAALAVVDGFAGVALETNGNLNVPTNTVVPIWPSEDLLGDDQAGKWRFVWPDQGAEYDTLIGDGSNTTYTVTHNLNTQVIVPAVIDTVSNEVVYPTVAFPTANTATVTFLTAPSPGQYRVVFLPRGGGTGVNGPATSTDNGLPRFDGTTGRLLQGSTATLDDSGNLTLAAAGNTTVAGTAAAGGTLTLRGTTNATSPGQTVIDQPSNLTNTSLAVLDVFHDTSANTGAGFGTSATLSGRNATGAKVTIASLDAVLTDATNTSEDGSWVLRMIAGGALTEALRVVSPGVLRLPVESAPGTPPANTGYLYFDSSGHLHSVSAGGTDTDLTAGAAPTEGTATAAGSSQGTATQLTATSTDVTGADGTKGVILKDVPGYQIVWNNDATNVLKVYPPSGAKIGTNGTNAAATQANTLGVIYWRVDATHWGSGGIGALT